MDLKVEVPTRIIAPPPMSVEVIQQVLAFLSGLTGTEAIPKVPIF